MPPDDRARRMYRLGYRAGLRVAGRRHKAEIVRAVAFLDSELARARVEAAATDNALHQTRAMTLALEERAESVLH